MAGDRTDSSHSQRLSCRQSTPLVTLCDLMLMRQPRWQDVAVYTVHCRRQSTAPVFTRRTSICHSRRGYPKKTIRVARGVLGLTRISDATDIGLAILKRSEASTGVPKSRKGHWKPYGVFQISRHRVPRQSDEGAGHQVWQPRGERTATSRTADLCPQRRHLAGRRTRPASKPRNPGGTLLEA